MEGFNNSKRLPPRPPTQAEINGDTDSFFSEQKTVEYFNNKEKEEQKPQGDFDKNVILTFLKKHMGVTFMKHKYQKKNGDIEYERRSLFKTNHVPCGNFAKDSGVISFEIKFKGDVPVGGVPLYFKDIPEIIKVLDPSKRLTIVTCSCRGYENKSEHLLACGLNIMKDHHLYKKSDLGNMEFIESIGGALGYASVSLKPNHKDHSTSVFLKIQEVKSQSDGKVIRYHFGNPSFMKSTFGISGDPYYGPWIGKQEKECCEAEKQLYVNGKTGEIQSLWNGIIRIPQDVCKEAGLPIYSLENAEAYHINIKKQAMEKGSMMDDSVHIITEQERKHSKVLNVPDENKIRCWYAMDLDHTLSWAFTLPLERRKQMGLFVKSLDLEIKKKNKTLQSCWLVPDVDLRYLMKYYQESWYNQIDIRKDWTNEVAFVIAPNNIYQGTLKNVEASLQIHLTAISWDAPDNFNNVAPVLDKRFPSAWDFNFFINK
jgi:hypothetical protein